MLDQIDDSLKKNILIPSDLIAQATELVTNVSSYPNPVNPLYAKIEVNDITNRYLAQLYGIFTKQPDSLISVTNALADMLDPNIENEVLASRNVAYPSEARFAAIEGLAQTIYSTIQQGCFQKGHLAILRDNLRTCIYATDDQMAAPKRLNIAQLYIMILTDLARQFQDVEEIREWLRSFHDYLPQLEPIDPQRWVWRKVITLSTFLNTL